jgi:hypothetical protein
MMSFVLKPLQKIFEKDSFAESSENLNSSSSQTRDKSA